MNQSTLGLVPLSNFAVVDEMLGLYRSAQPLYGYQYHWLSDKLKIKTIINLRGEAFIDERYVTPFNMDVIDIHIKDHQPPTMEEANYFMSIIRDKTKYPILIHCQHGHGRTSVACVLARLAMGWSMQDALDEESKVYQYSWKYKSQKEFLNYLNLNLSTMNASVTSTGSIPENVGFPSASFSTGEVRQPAKVNPSDYGKTLQDEYGRNYLQTEQGKIY